MYYREYSLTTIYIYIYLPSTKKTRKFGRSSAARNPFRDLPFAVVTVDSVRPEHRRRLSSSNRDNSGRGDILKESQLNKKMSTKSL